MNRGWVFWLGVLLAIGGTMITRLDIGSPNAGHILSIIGLGMVFWDFVRRGGT